VIVLALAAAVALAACVQSATGFGFALVAAPALFAAMSPGGAVTAMLVLGLAVNLLVLLGERRPLEVRRGELRPVLLASLPGVVAGVLVLHVLAKPALQLAVGVAVIAFALVQAYAMRAGAHPPGGGVPGWAMGALVGTLTTSTAVNGPPLLLWLQARGATPGEIRDSLAAAFLVLNLMGVAAVTVAGGGDPSFDARTLALLPAAAAGHLIGRQVFLRLHDARFRPLALALAVAAGAASVAAALV
jgi:uncharacterized membrane protein YfcA